MKNKTKIFIDFFSVNIFIELLLFLILMYPNNYQIIKLPVIGILLLYSIILIGKKDVKITHKIYLWGAIYWVSNLVFLSIGSYKNMNVLKELGPLKIIWPLLYLFIIIITMSAKKVKIRFDHVILTAGVLIPSLILLTYLFEGLPSFFNIIFPYTRQVYANFMDYYSSSITSLFFIGSYSIARFLIFDGEKSKKSAVSLILIVIVALVIGRRALLITMFITPFLFLLVQVYTKQIKIELSKIVNKKNIILCAILLFILLLIIYLFPLITGANLRIFEIFQGNEVFQNNERLIQFRSLISGWLENPLMGAGFGTNVEVVRSTDYLGLYELSYIAMLFQTGIVGTTIYLSLYSWLIMKLIKIYILTKDPSVLSFCMGTIAMFTANFSNPYIDSFDGLFFIFFSLAIINKFEIEKENNNEYCNINGNI